MTFVLIEFHVIHLTTIRALYSNLFMNEWRLLSLARIALSATKLYASVNSAGKTNHFGKC